jgi:hypothetical protein
VTARSECGGVFLTEDLGERFVGWSPSTTVKMAARYGHFTRDDLRSAVEAISSPQTDFSTAVPGIAN